MTEQRRSQEIKESEGNRNRKCTWVVLFSFSLHSERQVNHESYMRGNKFQLQIKVSFIGPKTQLFSNRGMEIIGPHEDLLTIVKRRKLQWYGHVSRSSGLAKTILRGTVKGGRKDKADRGRGGKTTSGNGLAWSLPNPRGRWRKGKNGGNWLRNHLWCPNENAVKG